MENQSGFLELSPFTGEKGAVPRMLHSAPPLRRGALLIRGPWPQSESVGPGSAVPAEEALHRVRDMVASIVESARAASP